MSDKLTWYNVGPDPTMTCGCVLYNDGEVTQCPLHAAAEEMRRTLGNLVANQHGAESVKAICFNEARALLARVDKA